MRIGFDIDGCLANFQPAYIDTCIEVAGKDLFPERPFDIPCWNYPEYYGYSDAEVKAVWNKIKGDDKFWWHLQPYDEAFYAMEEITKLWQAHHDIYFITDRPGVAAKLQTEAWLLNFGTGILPTVLLSSGKGPIAQGLKLDFYIDDKNENCEAVKRVGTNVIMMAQTWNTDLPGIPRIPNWKAFFEAIKETAEVVN